MLVFSYIVFGLLITGATVYGLHRYQTMEVEYNVDRTMPLPPLSKSFKAELTPDKTPEESPQVAINNEPATSSFGSTGQGENSTETTGEATDASNSSGWQTRVNTAKKSDNLDLAYQICLENFPLWGAYNQSCIILRSRMKSLQLSRAESEKLLRELYRTAVIAELLHDKSESAEHLTLNQLRGLPLEQLADEEFSYSAIGYAQLRLIRKSDVKTLLALWGRPAAHALPRDAHPEIWNSLRRNPIA